VCFPSLNSGICCSRGNCHTDALIYPFMRLLLVEDELDIQGFLKRSLEEAGYQVEGAADGKTAERLAIGGAFDILIVDLGLPDQDGITLILRLRELGFELPC